MTKKTPWLESASELYTDRMMDERNGALMERELENENTLRKSFPSATLSTTNPT
jgi:hypothetical protein